MSKKKRAGNDVLLAVKAINRVALAQVPVIGTTITALMGVYGAAYQERRLDTLANELTGVMTLVEGKVDRKFLETDDWAALVMRVVRDALQTSDRKKVRYLAAVLGGSATADRIEPLEVEAILNALAQLTSTDMVLARAVIDQMGKGHNYLEGDAIPNVVPNPWFHAARLESVGFIERSSNALPLRTAPYVPATVLKQLMEMIAPLLA